MRIAILIYGEPRELDYAQQFWPFSKLENCSVDYYFGLWTEGETGSGVTGETVQYTYQYKQIANLKPKRFLVPHPSELNVPKNSKCDYRDYSYGFIFQRTMDLIEDSSQYDLFILMRPDLYFSDDAKNILKADLEKCIEQNISGIIHNDFWCEDIFMILNRQTFEVLKSSNITEILATYSGHSAIHPTLAQIFSEVPRFLPETRNHIEVIRPTVRSLDNPTLEDVRRKFYEWGNFHRIQL